MPGSSFVFAHIADAHVGAWARDPSIREALRESVLRALEVVEERDCAFLLISGDLFHTPVPEPAQVAPIASALRRLVDHGRRVYVIYGSHDYVAHRTSWLDVLAETGIFLKAAPEPVRKEGDRFTLPFRIDIPTGAVIAGLSGRAHGLDAGSFRAVDSEAFRATKGFHIFQFHAAIREYLPEHLQAHLQGISREDLPGGCDYYAGGHIHYTYTGEGPGGGLLVNPGAVFGTSLPDLENGQRGRTHQGVVIVTVEDGHPSAEFVDTAPRDRVRFVPVDVDGRTAEEVRTIIEEQVRAAAVPGELLIPQLSGTLRDGGARTLGLMEATRTAENAGVAGVHWDLSNVVRADEVTRGADRPEHEVEIEALRALVDAAPAELVELQREGGLARLQELVRELGVPRGEGEAKRDYLDARTETALRILGVSRRTSRARPPESTP
jgi:DNA repair protein SbcD/Mre11